MKKLIFLALIISSTVQGAWQETDGTLDFVCGNGKDNFIFKAYYNDQSPKMELAYDISVKQFPFLGAEVLPLPQAIPGCQKAPLEFKVVQNVGNVYFECAADGDAGFGEITADFNAGKMELNISFPEGQPTLKYPYKEDTTITLPCSFEI